MSRMLRRLRIRDKTDRHNGGLAFGSSAGSGQRSDDLTVRSMIGEARQFSGEHPPATGRFTIGVTSTLRPLPAWKHDADRLFAQVTFAVEPLLEWRASIDFAGPVYAGVMVVASASMGRKLTSDIAQLAVPTGVIERLERDRDAGVDIACDLVMQIKASEAFDGVHLVPVGRYREVASRLEPMLRD